MIITAPWNAYEIKLFFMAESPSFGWTSDMIFQAKKDAKTPNSELSCRNSELTWRFNENWQRREKNQRGWNRKQPIQTSNVRPKNWKWSQRNQDKQPRLLEQTASKSDWWKAARGGYSAQEFLDNGRSKAFDLDGCARVTVGDDGKSTNGGSKTKTMVLRPEKK